MPTPYDNYDPGFTRADRRIAEAHGIDLDAPTQVKCQSCFKYHEAAELNAAGDCPTCAAEIHAQETAAFLADPTMAKCLGLMGAR
jgi:hypothetical protein